MATGYRSHCVPEGVFSSLDDVRIYVSGVAGDSGLRPKLTTLCRGQKTTEPLLSATSYAIPFNAGWRFLLWADIQQYPIRVSNAVT